MKPNITLMDGAVGTSLWAKAEAKGIKKDPVWKYNREHPDIVAELAAEYADAGAEIVSPAPAWLPEQSTTVQFSTVPEPLTRMALR